MRWGDGLLKVIRPLDVPVSDRRWPVGKSAGVSPRKRIEWRKPRSDWKWFQEKPLSFSSKLTVPQTDTGGQEEDSKALERTQEKELGKLTP